MLPGSNVHTHTVFSDGDNTAEEMVRAALRLGFHTLGFSDHGHAEYDRCGMSLAREAAYREEIRRLQQLYAGRIHILLGYEHDWLSPADFTEYEYVIESVHFVPVEGGVFCVDRSRSVLEDAIQQHFAGDPYRMCQAYFRTVCESCARTRADVLGHMDLVMKFNEGRDLFDDGDPRYLDAALEAADCAADRGLLVEINTGAIARGYRTEPYPGGAILKRLRQRDARILLSSDCHNSAYLDCGFETAAAVARACGFRTAWMYRGKQAEEYPL